MVKAFILNHSRKPFEALGCLFTVEERNAELKLLESLEAPIRHSKSSTAMNVAQYLNTMHGQRTLNAQCSVLEPGPWCDDSAALLLHRLSFSVTLARSFMYGSQAFDLLS